MTYNDKVLPPLIILTAPGLTKRLEADLLSRFHHIEGKWGHNRRRSFSPYIAASTKGSMSAEILKGYFLHISQLYPDMEDVDKKRVIWKLDNGVGRDDPELNHLARVLGFVIHPGLPNSSEGTQECDQNFSTLKSKMEKNRQDIVSQNQLVTLFDLAFILFGGDYKCQNGNTIQLVNAFESSFTVNHCRSAREKCGYCPATRCALFHSKCRRVLGDNLESMNNLSPRSNTELIRCLNDKDDEILQGCDNGENMYTKMMLEIEKMNEDSCKKLQELGYVNASLLKRKLRRDNEFGAELNAHSIRTYPPGSLQRQDQMMKARYPGEYFAITSGGAPNNCDDMLIAMQQNQLSKDAKRLKKKKEKIQQRQKVVKEALEIMLRPNDSTKKKGPTTNVELKICIQWKKNLEKAPKGKQSDLRIQWGKCKDNELTAEEATWTESNEQQLRAAESGEIPNFKHAKQFKIAYANKCIYVKNQATTLQKKSQMELLLSLYEDLPYDMKDRFKSKLNEIDLGIGIEYSCFSYDSDADDNSGADCNSDANDDYSTIMDTHVSKIHESFLDDQQDKEETESSSEDKNYSDTICASGRHCRCPWLKQKFAHTCTECGKPVHSFCFGSNEEGGGSKCALCVFPNGVCEQSLIFEPPSADQLSDTTSFGSSPSSMEASPNVSIAMDEESIKNMEIILDDNESSNAKEDKFFEDNDMFDLHPGNGLSDLSIDKQHSSSSTTTVDDCPSSSFKPPEFVSNIGGIEEQGSGDTMDPSIISKVPDEEIISGKKFEDMGINELKKEFAKRNMKVGRVKKKSTFITKLYQYDEEQDK